MGVPPRGLTTLVSKYGGPQLSQQNRKPHGKNNNITAKPKTSQQKQEILARDFTLGLPLTRLHTYICAQTSRTKMSGAPGAGMIRASENSQILFKFFEIIE